MRADCIQAVSQAVGRPVTVAESRNIETRLYDAMKALAREDADAWEGMSQAQRLNAAAERAAADLVAEAALKRVRLAQTILAHDRIEAYTQAQVDAGIDADRLDAFTRLMAGKGDGKNNATSAESLGRAVAAQTMGKLTETWDAIQPGMMGLLSDRRAEDALVRALYGDQAAPAHIRQAAQAWLTSAEDLRTRFNAAGGDVGKLDNWAMPQAWSAELASRAGRERFVDDFIGWLDRSQYVHPDGRRYSDDELRAFLGEAWMTIVTNGASKPIKLGAGAGGSVKANRHNQSRQIHLKSPDAALAALRGYSGRSVFEAMAGHVQRMARDIALVETFGPNADHAVQHFIDSYRTEAARTNPTAEGKLDARTQKAANLYNYVAGNAAPPANSWLANGMAMLRAWMTAAKLGSAAITSLTDEGTLYLTSKVNNLPLNQVFLNEVRAFNLADRTEKRLARRAGLLVNSMLDDIDRFGAETTGSQIPQKMASAVLRASGLSAMTEARRRAFSITMMDAIGALTREVDSVDKLDPSDWRILRAKGIDDQTWAIWRAATPDRWSGNDTVLTPDAIYAIPDAAMREAVAPALERLRAADNSAIMELDRRNAEELQWIANRQGKFDALQRSIADEIERLQVGKTAEANAAIDALQAQSELLQARIDLVRAQRGQELAAAGQGSADRVRGLISKAASNPEEAANILEGGADAATAGAMRRGYSAGAAAGEQIGRIKTRISQIEQRVGQIGRAADRSLGDRAESLGRRISAAREDLDAFVERSEERQRRRNEVSARIAAGIDPKSAEFARLAKDRAASKLLAVVLEERDFAVLEPGARERATLTAGTQRGTVGGELLRSFLQFKTFPIAMVMRHWGRALNLYDGTAGKVGYIGALVATQTLMGAVALEVNDIVSGRDPRSLNPASEFGGRNLLAAVLKGGALSLYGDFLFADTNEFGRTLAGAIGGPGLGLIEDTFKLTVGNLQQLAKGEETDAGAEAVRFARAYAPGASLWYTKAALDRMIFHQLQEYFSPGYLSRSKRKSAESYGTSYWWDPGAMPDEARAPDVENVIAE